MKSAITNIGRNYVAQNIDAGMWFSVTHFSLAWVTNHERSINTPRPEMTEFVTQVGDGTAHGDIIYNIWQSSFKEALNNKEFGFLTNSISDGFGSKFKYEYDDCNNINTLLVTTAEYVSDVNYTSGAGSDATTSFEGAKNNGLSYVLGELSTINTPCVLKDAQINLLPHATRADKLFPIKSFRVVSTTEDVINAKNTVIDYQLELPSVNTQDELEQVYKGIGNFKFNRIGIYVTKSAGVNPQSGIKNVSLTPVANEEPVLFAVIDLSTDLLCSDDAILDIYKTRDNKGLNAWQADVQLNITSVLDCVGLLDVTPYYRDAIRDDATRWFMSQLEGQVVAQKAILDLQTQIIQLSNMLNGSLKLDQITSKKGFNKIEPLNINSEYSIGKISDKTINYFDAKYFRSTDSVSTNESNCIIDLFNNSFEDNNLSDGDIVKVIISNLDGRYLMIDSTKLNLWNGKILFVNKSRNSDEFLFEINHSHISGLSSAKICIDFTYSADNTKWILTSFSVVDEATSEI